MRVASIASTIIATITTSCMRFECHDDGHFARELRVAVSTPCSQAPIWACLLYTSDAADDM
eukprot:7654342-Alexandrium_andersonii.AAC.1